MIETWFGIYEHVIVDGHCWTCGKPHPKAQRVEVKESEGKPSRASRKSAVLRSKAARGR